MSFRGPGGWHGAGVRWSWAWVVAVMLAGWAGWAPAEALGVSTGGRDIESVFLPGHPASAGRPYERRVVMQTSHGDLEFALFPEVAPVTVKHILDLIRFGLYDTASIFRVDKGFVAQVTEVTQRRALIDAAALDVATQRVPSEFFFEKLRHVRGVLSMGRTQDPNSGTSSFSILLGDAPHLDGEYTAFGCATKGDDVLRKLEALPTRTEGIFVMPLERIEITSMRLEDRDRDEAVREAEESAGGDAAEMPKRGGSRVEADGRGPHRETGPTAGVVAKSSSSSSSLSSSLSRGWYLPVGVLGCVGAGVGVRLSYMGRRLGHRASRRRSHV